MISAADVGAVKQGEQKKSVSMALSINHLSWAAVLDWYYHAVPVTGADRAPSELVDPLGNSDEVGSHRQMPPLAHRDCIAFLDAGGYTESCAAWYNAQLLPASVLVSGSHAEIITEREQLKDIARLPGSSAPACRLLRAQPSERTGHRMICLRAYAAWI